MNFDHLRNSSGDFRWSSSVTVRTSGVYVVIRTGVFCPGVAWKLYSFLSQTESSNFFKCIISRLVTGADPENSERRGRVPHSVPRMKTSAWLYCYNNTRKTVRRVGVMTTAEEMFWMQHTWRKIKKYRLKRSFFSNHDNYFQEHITVTSHFWSFMEHSSNQERSNVTAHFFFHFSVGPWRIVFQPEI